MKITVRNLLVLLAIIGIILISGCTGEKKELKTLEEKQQEQEQKAAETPQAETPQEGIVEGTNKTEPGTKPADEANKTEPEKIENYSDSDWCSSGNTTGYLEGTSIWVDGVVEFKGKKMCRMGYTSADENGTRKYDIYAARNDEEIWRVITYPDGRVEETKIEKSEFEHSVSTIGKTNKDPSAMVLELHDLPLEYNIIQNKTGATTKEDYTYSPEKLSEMGWKGGYKTAFENEKTYLFGLNLDYKQYLKEGEVDERLQKAFEDNHVSLYSDTKLYKINDKNWKTYNENRVKYGHREYYIIEETNESLKVYERSSSYLLSYRFISNVNSVYSPDKIKEAFNDTKRIMSASAVFVSAPDIGDECALYKKEFADIYNYTAYALIFRKLNVYENIQIIGLKGFVDENEIIDLAKIVEKKIE